MIYGYLLIAIMGLVLLYQLGRWILPRRITGKKGPPVPFDVTHMRAAELRLAWRLNFAKAVKWQRERRASGLNRRAAEETLDKLVLIRYRLDVLEERIPLGGGDISMSDYRRRILNDVYTAANGEQV